MKQTRNIRSLPIAPIAAIAFTGVLLSAPVAADIPRGISFGVLGGMDTFDVRVRTSDVSVSNLELRGPSVGAYVSSLSEMPDLGGLIGGFEASYRLSDADGRFRAGDFNVEVDARESWGIAARLGFEPAPNTLVYGRAGWIRTRFSGLAESGRDELDGFRFGAGVDVGLGGNLSIRGELTRTVYEDFTAGDRRIDTGQNALTIGVGYFF